MQLLISYLTVLLNRLLTIVLKNSLWIKIIMCVQNLTLFHFISEPNDESAANVDAAKIWREDRTKFNEVAQRTVRKSLGL